MYPGTTPTPHNTVRRRPRDPLGACAPIPRVRLKHLTGKSPQLVYGRLDPRVTLLRAVAELDHPLGAVPDMVSLLLHRLGGKLGDSDVAALLQGVHQVHAECVEEKLPRDREREITARELDELNVAELNLLAKKRELVRGAAVPLRFRRQLKGAVRLPQEIERDVGQRDVFLEDGPVTAPLRKTVTENQPVVAEPETEFGDGAGRGGGGIRHQAS